MDSIREFKESPLEIGTEETKVYPVTIPSTWGTPTGSPTIKMYSYDEGTAQYTDVTSTTLSGTATVETSPTVRIVLPAIHALTADVVYRIEAKFNTTNGEVNEAFGWIKCTR